MPRIVILAKPGRSQEQKKALAQKVTDAVVEEFGGDAASVTIYFSDMHDDQVAEGGKLKSER